MMIGFIVGFPCHTVGSPARNGHPSLAQRQQLAVKTTVAQGEAEVNSSHQGPGLAFLFYCWFRVRWHEGSEFHMSVDDRVVSSPSDYDCGRPAGLADPLSVPFALVPFTCCRMDLILGTWMGEDLAFVMVCCHYGDHPDRCSAKREGILAGLRLFATLDAVLAGFESGN